MSLGLHPRVGAEQSQTPGAPEHRLHPASQLSRQHLPHRCLPNEGSSFVGVISTAFRMGHAAETVLPRCPCWDPKLREPLWAKEGGQVQRKQGAAGRWLEAQLWGMAPVTLGPVVTEPLRV